MKQSPLDRMCDPFFAQLMFIIEQMISAADEHAKTQGIILKDSQVQSALTKAKGLAAGKSPKIPDSTGADKILHDLILELGEGPEYLAAQSVGVDGVERESPLEPEEWIMAIEAVIESVKGRRSEIPGSRYYLEFVKDFVEKAKSET